MIGIQSFVKTVPRISTQTKPFPSTASSVPTDTSHMERDLIPVSSCQYQVQTLLHFTIFVNLLYKIYFSGVLVMQSVLIIYFMFINLYTYKEKSFIFLLYSLFSFIFLLNSGNKKLKYCPFYCNKKAIQIV